MSTLQFTQIKWHALRSRLADVCALTIVALTLVSCGKVSGLPTFKSRSGLANSIVSVTSDYVLSTIDAGSGPSSSVWTVNNDISVSCVRGSTDTDGVVGLIGGSTNTTRGCMQPPAVIYADGRWMVGFSQNYLWNGAAPTKFSAFVNMSSLTTGLFGTLGSGLGIIDTGLGVDASNTDVTSSRYIRFASLPNGDVIAVYWIELPTAGGVTFDRYRTVFASVYNASTNTWGAATQLGTTDAATDFGIDFGNSAARTHMCRPAVAAAGNNTAIATWCEDPEGAVPSIIRSAVYANGSWTTSDLVSTSTLRFPATSGAISEMPANFITNLNADDFFTGTITTAAGVDEVATVTAVDAYASSSQFNIVRDSTSTVLPCQTLKNMITALLNVTVTGCSTSPCSTLSRLGVTALLNPECTETDSSTWTVSLYYNRALADDFRDSAVGENVIVGLSYDDDDGAGVTSTTTAFTTQDDYRRAGAVDIAADGYGNYAMVRTVVSPYYDESDITQSGISRGRILVGHEYKVNSGWRSFDTTSYANDPDATRISRSPTCSTGATYTPNTGYSGDVYEACSVKNPKILMSKSGKGLILYHQRQFAPYQPGSSTHPNRLYYATYGTTSGFSVSAEPLDPNTVCTAGSVTNDVSVCETGTLSLTSSTACQTTGEPASTTYLSVDHDVPPIAAAMNDNGEAIVAFHKQVRVGTDSTTRVPNCSYIATFATFYDTFNGFGDVVQLNDNTGSTAHVAVAIASSGVAAVVWEQTVSVGTNSYATDVYLRKRSPDGNWSPAVVVNEARSPAESMMPSVGIRSTGEVVVTYTYGETSTTRRQYSKLYYAK